MDYKTPIIEDPVLLLHFKQANPTAYKEVRRLYSKDLYRLIKMQVQQPATRAKLFLESFEALENRCRTFTSMKNLHVYLFLNAQFIILKHSLERTENKRVPVSF